MVNYVRNIDKKKLHNMWHNMYNRCYSNKYHEGSPQYVGCSMCDEWLDDKEAFFEWVRENYYRVGREQMDLDKDILVKGNKVYSPETCVFAPHSINTYFENGNINSRAVFVEEIGKWKISLTVEGKRVPLGYFDTEEAAKLEYIKHKEAALIAKADLYRDKIPKKLYDAMVNWKIELSDWEN